MQMFNSKNTHWRDEGAEPVVENIERVAMNNESFRKTYWTGENLQVTVMSIPVGGDIGAEMHGDIDQILQIVDGFATVLAGDSDRNMQPIGRADNRGIIIIPAKTWHNVINIGRRPLKLYSVYAPPHHQKNLDQMSKN